ncbi:hypothetical protein KVR01_000847 [Diaporthe batatas]|uniref:uncharacterized protein n=1 Tax=Diaporthe batatas TaxID=748121 RepID=UPI001D036F50|nr:uncharacterized protein KVR01_000847 [Diaporthe batatas]KAG8170102.1 hypothetical protein KVR01_000847 [Diaporthe batatas]
MPEEEAAVRRRRQGEDARVSFAGVELGPATETRDGRAQELWSTVSTWQVTLSDPVRTCEERFGNAT